MQAIDVGLQTQMASLSAEMAALRAVVDASLGGVALGVQPSAGPQFPATLPSSSSDVYGDDWCALLEYEADRFEPPKEEAFQLAEIALLSPDPAVRVAAGRVLARGDEGHRAQVRTALNAEMSAYVIRALESALGTI